MNIDTLNKKIRGLAVGDNQELITFINNNVKNKVSHKEKIEIYTIGAMYASSSGCFENLKTFINEDPEILIQKEQGILRMTVDIESFDKFKEIINFLIINHKDKLDFNARENSWIKECIKNECLNKIEYIIETGNHLEINDNIIKTLVRNKNKDIFDYFIFNLEIPINDNLENWLKENNHKEELQIIKKRNLFNNLDKDLVNKKNQKMRKI